MDSYGKKAGKGALIQEELSGTLGVSQDQYLFQPLAKSYGFCPQVGGSEYASLGMVEDRAPTLTANQTNGVVILNPYDSQDNQMTVAYGIDTYNQAAEEEVMQTIRTNGGGDCIPKVVYSIENHPNDSRVQFSKDGKVQALTSRMGTGGGQCADDTTI